MPVDEVMGHSAANVLGAGGMEANGANSDLNGLESIHTYLRNLESGRVANDAPYYPFFESYGTREETTLEETLESYGASMQTHGNKELKEAWSALVRDSAKSVGRANSNIKRYLGDAVVERQLAALGGQSVRAVLEICRSHSLSEDDRAVLSRIISQARRKIKSQDVGSLAAFSAVNTVYGAE